jgi:hypothetical protein
MVILNQQNFTYITIFNKPLSSIVILTLIDICRINPKYLNMKPKFNRILVLLALITQITLRKKNRIRF